MIKSGIIVGAIAFVYIFVTSIAMTACAPFEAVGFGIAAGVLAAIIDKPQLANKAAVSGAIAGMITAVIAGIGNTIGFLIRTYVIFTPDTAMSLTNQMFGMQSAASDAALAQVSTVFTLCCCVIIDAIVIVGLGALGGYLWFQYKGRNAAPRPPQVIS